MHAVLKRLLPLGVLVLAAATLSGCVVEPAPYYGETYYQPAPAYYYGPTYYYGPRYGYWHGDRWHGDRWHGGHHHWH